MNDSILKSVLEKSLMHELAEYENENVPEHKFSLKHRLAMKRIFARYERNVQRLQKKQPIHSFTESEYKPHLSLKQRLLLVTIVIILMTFLVGWVVVFVSEKFHGTVYHDNTLLTAVDIDNCPQTIDYKYSLISVPEGFELIDTNSSPIDVYTLYMNKQTKQTITLFQTVKADFSSHYNTEGYEIKEVKANGKIILFIDFGDKIFNRTLVVWDNGDYIIEILADLDKDQTLDLCDIAKS